MGERLDRTQEVAGSSPASSTFEEVLHSATLLARRIRAHRRRSAVVFQALVPEPRWDGLGWRESRSSGAFVGTAGPQRRRRLACSSSPRRLRRPDSFRTARGGSSCLWHFRRGPSGRRPFPGQFRGRGLRDSSHVSEAHWVAPARRPRSHAAGEQRPTHAAHVVGRGRPTGWAGNQSCPQTPGRYGRAPHPRDARFVPGDRLTGRCYGSRRAWFCPSGGRFFGVFAVLGAVLAVLGLVLSVTTSGSAGGTLVVVGAVLCFASILILQNRRRHGGS